MNLYIQIKTTVYGFARLQVTLKQNSDSETDSSIFLAGFLLEINLELNYRVYYTSQTFVLIQYHESGS